MTIAELFNLNPEQIARAQTVLINLTGMVQRLHEHLRPYVEATATYLAKPETRELILGMQRRLEEMRSPVMLYVPHESSTRRRLPPGIDPDAKLPPLPHNRAGFTLPGIHDDEEN